MLDGVDVNEEETGTETQSMTIKREKGSGRKVEEWQITRSSWPKSKITKASDRKWYSAITQNC